ncbi:MAG: type I-B CRISPR-associated endonuclease Cas1b [Bacillota bacterium]|nr:type I-B CRISPR-associated endonuclease Cas1b [Bacillota bacterium]
MAKTVYIFSNGELKRKGNTLCFEAEDGQTKYVPVGEVAEIMAFGELSFNKKCLEFLSQNEILLHYFSHYGYYMGTFYPREHLNAGLVILKQAEHYLDAGKRVELARGFVRGAQKNMLQVLRYYNRRGRLLDEPLQAIVDLGQQIEGCTATDELMAVEGNIRNTYYAAFDTITEDPVFKFEVRSRRPPQNHLNCLISFGNTFLYTVVLSEIYKTHLDPRIGYLHATNFRRFSLNLDVAEVFKPIIVDRAIFAVVGRRQLTEKEFEAGTEGIVLTEQGRKTFVAELEEKLQTTLRHQALGRNVSYRRLIRLELYKLEKHILGERTYEPFVARW